MARQQQLLDRQVQDAPPEEREWRKQRLQGIRHWNRQPDENGKPLSMRKPSAYEPSWEDMDPWMREWYEACSLYVHPTFRGEQDVGRSFAAGEATKITRAAHGYLCFIAYTAAVLEAALKD